MRKNILITVLLILIGLNGNCQKSKKNQSVVDESDVVITLKDGNTKNGKVSFPILSNEKEFKITIGDKTEKVSKKDVEKITFKGYNGAIIDYYNVRIDKSSDKTELMQAAIPIGKVKLYTYTWGNGKFRPVYNMQGFSSGGINFYCKRDNEDYATAVAFNDGKSVNRNSLFKKRASKYFADNPTIVQKIKNGEYKYTDIAQVVIEYNGLVTVE
ncbi:hypothetical protein [Flavobacterium okayamense]|uniref:Lipoprotein n=1 Tax=Flavobacterium okayamense TaxID=2830782 RepID=A0ABM7SE46_9FLAO|nr:hypothetical protein [Flavobacterium okayamense]BCY29058.1 hypothetical protein KK2020170_19260 [Flavobacterium okayamense]